MRNRISVLIICSLSLLAGTLHGKNVLLISVDTLRADRLSCYGYKQSTTPTFDKWASEGLLFEKAYSEYPLTLPSHATLFTGTLPPRHGVRENVGFELSQHLKTLAELFRERGYSTGGFIGAYVLAAEFGMAQGFQTYDEDFEKSIEMANASTEVQRSSEVVTDRFLSWLDRQEGNFFAFVHFYDPHTPRPSGYDREVSRVDRSLARIDSYLRSKDLLKDTHIVLTSDHGESLGDHGEEGHGFFIYDSTLHIPLIIRPAQTRVGPGGRVEEAVSLVDLMPTILELADIEIPESVEGESLYPLLSGNEIVRGGLYAETLVPQFHFGWSSLRSFRVGKYKYIEAPRPELYNLQDDPRELENIYSEKTEIAQSCQQRLQELLTGLGDTDQGDSAQEIDPEVAKRLAALGYVRLGGVRVDSDSEDAIDPKDRIDAFQKYHDLINHLARGSVRRPILSEIEALHLSAPEMQEVIFLRGWAHELLGQDRQAIQDYRRALSEDPDNPMTRSRYAGLLLKTRDFEEAELQLREILSQNPRDYRSRNNLAGLLHMTGRSDEAASEMEKIVEFRPQYAPGWQNLGQLYLQSQQWNAAERAFRRLLTLQPNSGVGHFLLSQALGAQGKETEAKMERARAFQLEPRLRNQ